MDRAQAHDRHAPRLDRVHPLMALPIPNFSPARGIDYWMLAQATTTAIASAAAAAPLLSGALRGPIIKRYRETRLRSASRFTHFENSHTLATRASLVRVYMLAGVDSYTPDTVEEESYLKRRAEAFNAAFRNNIS